MRDFLILIHLQSSLHQWNGPKVQHSDEIVKETLDRMHGSGTWHFTQDCSRRDLIKTYNVSKAVDSIQRQHSSFYL